MEPQKPHSFASLVATSDVPVLADFYADWCGPCQDVAPVICQLAREYAGKLTTVKINTDRRPELAADYEVTAIPTVILFCHGQPVARMQGALPFERMKAIIDQKLPIRSCARPV